jgi:hypothetical protein
MQTNVQVPKAPCDLRQDKTETGKQFSGNISSVMADSTLKIEY